MPKKKFDHLFPEDTLGPGGRPMRTKIKRIEPNLYVDPDGAFYLRFVVNKRPWQRKLNATTLREAREEAHALIRYIKDEAKGQVTQRNIPTVSEAIVMWSLAKKGSCSDGYISQASRVLSRILAKRVGHHKVDAITPASLRKIVREYQQKEYTKGTITKAHSPRTANQFIQCIKSLFTFLVKDGYLQVSPASRMETYDEPEQYKNLIPLEDYSGFLERIDALGLPHISLQVRAMLYLGLRSTEAVGMRWANWDQVNGKYTPGKTVQTKGKETASLKVPTALRIWLELALQATPRDLVYIHTNPDTSKPYNSRVLRWHMARVSAEMGVRVTPHNLRASYITILSQTHDLPTVQRLARHADIETTMSYIQVAQERMDSAVSETFG